MLLATSPSLSNRIWLVATNPSSTCGPGLFRRSCKRHDGRVLTRTITVLCLLAGSPCWLSDVGNVAIDSSKPALSSRNLARIWRNSESMTRDFIPKVLCFGHSRMRISPVEFPRILKISESICRFTHPFEMIQGYMCHPHNPHSFFAASSCLAFRSSSSICCFL